MKPTRRVSRPFEQAREKREITLRDARRNVILDGARKVFVTHGLDGATVRAIAAASGCTTGAIYPLFATKEAIYGALLAESLERLHAFVSAAASAKQTSSAASLQAGAMAFLHYYRDRPEEVALGLYLWGSVRPRGLTRDLDTELNRLLSSTLDVLQQAIRLVGSRSDAAAKTEAAGLFAFLIGALVTHQAGRLRTLGSNIDAIAACHLDALIARLSG